MDFTYILRIDSRDQTAASASNCNFVTSSLPFHTTALRLKQAVIPNLFPNIRSSPPSNNNSTFAYETGGVPASFVVPTGQYTISTLIDYLETQLTALTITFTIDPDTGKLTLNNGGAATFEIISDTNVNFMADVLGITTTSTVAPAGTATFGSVPNLFNHNVLYILSRRLCNSFNCVAGEQRLAVIGTVPVNVPYGGLIVYEPAEPQVIKFEADYPITEVDIQIINHYGEILELPLNHHINVTMECTRHHQIG